MDATNSNIVGELTSFKLCATTPNNTQQHGTGPGVQMDATCNIQQCWELLAKNVASGLLGALGLATVSVELKAI